MSIEQLWAPWRLAYIETARDDAGDGCFLCRYLQSDADADNYVVARSEHCLIVLNRFPYNNGHLLVAPFAHKATLSELSDAEHLDCMRQVTRLVAALQKAISPDGFNIGLNLGKAAGAGLPGHLHWHIVPRWNGDTNFMSVLSDVTVIPQSLEALFALLKEQLVQSGDS